MKKALVTGASGQDGSYLISYLLGLGYSVVGTQRRTSGELNWRHRELEIENHENLTMVEHDLTDLPSTYRIIEAHQPDEIYNLAAQSHVGLSFSEPIATAQITALGATNLLEAIRFVKPDTRFYQASSSEMFGMVSDLTQSETSAFYPRSPYGVAKVYAHWSTINYRESFGIFASSGILFNHESPLRGREFVTRKISAGIAQQLAGEARPLMLGNLDSQRDWGFAEEYVKGMWLMVQHHTPDTFVLASGQTTSVREFLVMCYNSVGIDIEFKGNGIEETGVDAATGKTLVQVDPTFFRPAEVDFLRGDASKAKRELGWHAETTVEKLAELMVQADIERIGEHH